MKNFFNFDYKEEIFSLYGSVKRARFYYLYTAKGVRLTDMFQENGRAILGWRHGKSQMLFKNVFDCGVLGNFKTDKALQLEKSVKKLFPKSISFAIFQENVLPEKFLNLPIWRPWSNINNNLCSFEAFKFYPPFPWGKSVFIIFTDSTKIVNSYAEFGATSIPSPLAASYARSIYDLILRMQLLSEKDFAKFDKVVLKYFYRDGCYLTPKCKNNEYVDFWKKSLKNGALLSPFYDVPSILPIGANLGDLKFE